MIPAKIIIVHIGSMSTMEAPIAVHMSPSISTCATKVKQTKLMPWPSRFSLGRGRRPENTWQMNIQRHHPHREITGIIGSLGQRCVLVTNLDTINIVDNTMNQGVHLTKCMTNVNKTEWKYLNLDLFMTFSIMIIQCRP